ncbi:hypothetical protein RJ641_022611 [Dillenia turbinata]|uniref:Embryo defective n=1 Tax=Dillenia turbinata TaxID=194707 RepID=A0AAN8UCU8_9MAGN
MATAAVFSLSFPNLSYKSPLTFASRTCLSHQNPSKTLPVLTNRLHLLKRNLSCACNIGLGFGRNLGFCVRAEKNGEGEVLDEVEEARKQSTMPDRFRYLTKEAPDPPVRWPWFVAMFFLIYAWKAVLWELSNWKKLGFAIIGFIGYLVKFSLAVIYQFVGDPITYLLMIMETALYSVRAFYSSIVVYAPVPELTMVIMLSSMVLAIGEATVPNAASSQSFLITLSGLIGYAAVRGFIIEPFFFTLLVGIFAFSRLVKKRDYVSSALPVAAVLAAVGEPWVRVLAIGSYLALAIWQHWNKLSMGKQEVEDVATNRKLPLPLLGVALAIGIRVAAKWAGYRHLTWMIV